MDICDRSPGCGAFSFIKDYKHVLSQGRGFKTCCLKDQARCKKELKRNESCCVVGIKKIRDEDGGGGGQAYSLVGNGWCNNKDIGGKPGNSRKEPGRIGIQGNWVKTLNYKKNGAYAAKSCETRCDTDPDCLGYITQDHTKCQIIPGSTYGERATTITGFDKEKRNYCWKKGKGCGEQ